MAKEESDKERAAKKQTPDTPCNMKSIERNGAQSYIGHIRLSEMDPIQHRYRKKLLGCISLSGDPIPFISLKDLFAEGISPQKLWQLDRSRMELRFRERVYNSPNVKQPDLNREKLDDCANVLLIGTDVGDLPFGPAPQAGNSTAEILMIQQANKDVSFQLESTSSFEAPQ